MNDSNLFNPKCKMTSKQRRATRRSQHRYFQSTRVPKSDLEKDSEKFASLTFAQLVRRLRQAARWSSHYKHKGQREPNSVTRIKFESAHRHMLVRFQLVEAEISIRIKGKIK